MDKEMLAGVLRPRAHAFRKRQEGFTLIEIMIVLAIMAIILAIAVPAYAAWRESTALQSATETLMAHIKQARVLSVSANRSVSIEFTPKTYTFDSTGPAPQQYPLKDYSGNLTMNPITFPASGSTYTLTFNSDGTSEAGSVTLNNADGTRQKITVNLVGRVYYN